jgi:RNA polymerase sigma factor (sigma-70 family)
MLSTTMATERSPSSPTTASAEALAGGDDLEALFRRHNRMVYRAAFRVTQHSSDAEDVLQTVFVRLATRDLTSQPLEQAESYLRRAAVNAALDLLRQRKRTVDDGEAEVSLHAAPAFEQPERQLRGKQAVAWLRNAVAGLSQQAAEIFVLRFIEERSNAEIAEMIGSTTNTVAVTLHRSRERLRHEFQQQMGGQHV